MPCQCSKKINTVKYSRIINDNLDEKEKMNLKKEIDLKIKQQFKDYCMYCGTQLNNNNIGSEKFSPIKIKVELNGNLIDHYICLNCKNKKNSSDKCKICEQKHGKSQKKDDNIINDNNNGKHNNNTPKKRDKRNTEKIGFCNGKCIIY